MDETTAAAPAADPGGPQGIARRGADGAIDRTDGSGDEGNGQPLGTVLEAVRDSVLHLLAGFSHPPAELRVRAGDVTVETSWSAPAGPVAAEAPGDAATGSDGGAVARAPARLCLHSPTVGTFYRAPEPGAAPFVEVGDTVRVGQQVAIVETMKLMIPVKADEAGTIAEVLEDDGASVEHGDALFVLADPSP